MKLSEYIDNELEKGVHDIIYKDERGINLEANCDHIEMDEVIDIKYQKVCIIKVKKRP